tara:strand:+ start:546 stop:1352 length:807 start_codon:yes stop_codon:yes gene_type:complete
MDKKKRNSLAGVNMAMALDTQSARDLAKLMKTAKKPGRAKAKKQTFDIKKPGAFGIQRNDIMKARFGGKVIQKMQSGGRKLSQEELEAAIREIEEQGTVFGKGSGLSKDQTKKIADSFEKSFNDIFGKKFGGVIKKMKKGGLMEAIKKVQAKEMQFGGDVPKPKMRPKKDPFRADKTKSLNEEFSKKVAKTNEKNMKNVKKDAVPPKYKGFSKLPEKVQQKIDEDLAAKYKMGGKVEEYGAGGNVGKGGKMACRGMGAAIKGGGFTIR